MPKSAGKKKKGKKDEGPPPLPIPRDLSEKFAVDLADGALGLGHVEVAERMASVTADLISWKISQAVKEGDFQMDLSGHDMDEIPNELFDLPWLTVVDFSRNKLVNTVFDDLAHMPGLKALNLSTNLLHGALPPSFGKLAAGLEELALEENVIEAVPVEAAVLTSLRWLSLRKNMLTALPVPCFLAWANLTYLDLRDNALTVLPEEIGACTKLEQLYVSGNSLTALPETIGSLSKLAVLYAHKNALTALPSSLAACGLMEELDVSSNQLTALPDEIFMALTNLRQLHAASNKIADLPASLSAARKLEVLILSSNPIREIPEDLGSLSCLREVYLNNTAITSFPASIAGWVNIEELASKNAKLKAFPGEVAGSWKAVKTVDVRGKKKDTCKMPQELVDSLKGCRMLGAVITKAKKKK